MNLPLLEIFNDSELESPALNQEALSAVVQTIYKDTQHSFDWINVVLLDSESHTAMNSKYLEHHYPTDILTFEYTNNDQKIDGELYINLEIAKENAKEFDVSYQNEVERLIIHGALHLVGYNDQTASEQKEMREMENHYLSLLND